VGAGDGGAGAGAGVAEGEAGVDEEGAGLLGSEDEEYRYLCDSPAHRMVVKSCCAMFFVCECEKDQVGPRCFLPVPRPSFQLVYCISHHVNIYIHVCIQKGAPGPWTTALVEGAPSPH
jgi:hypothetical protein